MRYRITASGSDTHPPIDEETDIDPMPMVRERGYRFVDCSLLTPIPYSQIMAALAQEKS